MNLSIRITSAVLFLLSIILVSVEAPKDGDLWWQMEYGRRLLENGTLISDHTQYSWTPSSNAFIYCAWIAQVLLHLIYESWGLIGLNVLRVTILALPVVLVLLAFRRYKISFPYFMLPVAFVAVYAAKHAAGLLKPELFGFMYFSILCFCYFVAKSDQSSKLAILTIPIIILLWINSHGTFAVGCLFLFIVLIGELLNRKFQPTLSFTQRQWKLVYITIPLALIATVATPYGWSYPIQLISWYTGTGTELASAEIDNIAYTQVNAYHSIFSDTFKHLKVIYFYGILVSVYALLVLETIKNRRFDVSILLVNIVFLYFSTGWARASYFSPIVLLMSISFLAIRSPSFERILSNKTAKDTLNIVSFLAMLLFAGTTFIAAKTSDSPGPVLSTGYLNPQDAARYVQNNHIGAKICNGYDGGGYLVWLFKDTKRVMIDPRYFPYKNWYRNWSNMVSSPDRDMIASYDCDLWILNHSYININSVLLNDPIWKMAYIGPAAAVFVKSTDKNVVEKVITSPKLSSHRSLRRSALILNSLLTIGDFQTAEALARETREYWIGTANEMPSLRALEFVRGTKYYREKKDILAYSFLLNAHDGDTKIWNYKRLEFSGQYAVAEFWKQGRYEVAQNIASKLIKDNPENLINLFNIGLLTLLIEEKDSYDWKSALQKFLANPSTGVPKEYYQYAKEMISSNSWPRDIPPLIPTDKRGNNK